MSPFRVAILVLVVVAAVFKLLQRGRRSGKETTPAPPEDGAACPHCAAPVEPGFLECWNCRQPLPPAGEEPDDPAAADGTAGRDST